MQHHKNNKKNNSLKALRHRMLDIWVHTTCHRCINKLNDTVYFNIDLHYHYEHFYSKTNNQKIKERYPLIRPAPLITCTRT